MTGGRRSGPFFQPFFFGKSVKASPVEIFLVIIAAGFIGGVIALIVLALLFIWKNSGLQNQSVLYVQEGLDGAPEVLIDPNTWSADGTVAVAGMEFSDDGRYVAYARAASGSSSSNTALCAERSGQDG